MTVTRFNLRNNQSLVEQRITYLPVLTCKLSEGLLEHFFTLFGSEEGRHKIRRCNYGSAKYEHTVLIQPYIFRFLAGFLVTRALDSYIPFQLPGHVL